MPIFYLNISSLSRGAGRRATAAAAYRAGERIRDHRSGTLYNFSRRRDVLHTEIFLPERFSGAPVHWARDREQLWNTAEYAEKHYNGRVAREYQVTLPVELNPTQRLSLARVFAKELAERYKVAVDLAVHAPPAGGDPRNFHAHLLTTTREVTPGGLGAKTGLDLHMRERQRRGLPDHRQEFVNVREGWAALVNDALREANIAARVDHRSLAAQGIDREPVPAIPLMHLKMEQQGLRSSLADRLRIEYWERVQARRALALSAEPQVGAQQSVSERQSAAGEVARPDASVKGKELDEIRREAREAWLRLRAATEQPERDQEASESLAEPGDELTL